MRSLWLFVAMLLSFACVAQAADTTGTTQDHWVVVDLKTWAWYLNFTSEQKAAVRAIDAQCMQRQDSLDQGGDYVKADTEPQRAARRTLMNACTAEVQAALDSARYARWMDLRNGAKPVKPSAGGTRMRLGIGLF